MLPDLTAIRTEYARAGLDERDLDPSPSRQVEKWLRDAIDAVTPNDCRSYFTAAGYEPE